MFTYLLLISGSKEGDDSYFDEGSPSSYMACILLFVEVGSRVLGILVVVCSPSLWPVIQSPVRSDIFHEKRVPWKQLGAGIWSKFVANVSEYCRNSATAIRYYGDTALRSVIYSVSLCPGNFCGLRNNSTT